MRNISLRLLNVTSPQEVLGLFEEEFIAVVNDAMEMEIDRSTEQATVEELFMFLYFFKSQIGELDDEQAKELIKSDYRVNLLVQMIFDKYVPSEVEFTYQVTTVLSLAILNKFYDLELTSDQKEKLVEGLLLVDGEQ